MWNHNSQIKVVKLKNNQGYELFNCMRVSDSASLWYFEQVNLYNVLCPNRVSNDERHQRASQFAKNEYVYFPNQNADNIYLVAEGKIKIGTYTDDGNEVTKSILVKGDIFGELALAGEEKRSDFAQVMDENTKICSIKMEELQSLMVDNKPLSLKIYKIIGLRFKKLEKRIESMVFKDARTRVVEFLRELAEEQGIKVGFEIMIKNHFTHKDIASLTGTSRQTVTTVLNELKENNLINFNRRQFLIRDLETLR